MLTLLWRRMSISPNEVVNQDAETLIAFAGLFGLLIHLGFTGLFLRLNLWHMVGLNVLSCGIWAGIIWLALHARPEQAIHLATVEMLAHAIIATALLGTSFGFHFYLWPISVVVTLNPSMSFRRSTIVALTTILIFGCLSIFVSSEQSSEYNSTTIDTILFCNILVAGFSMTFTGMLVRRTFALQSRVLKQHARTDELTKLFNRRYVLEFLQITENNRRRNHIPYCICICDLDHFKQINDTFGHDTGDNVLIRFSQLLQQSVRQSDCVARWGGEEFLVVLTNTNGNNAKDAVELLLDKLRIQHPITAGEGHQLSMSVGIAQATDNDSVDELIARADRALYQAKSQGRDRAVLNKQR